MTLKDRIRRIVYSPAFDLIIITIILISTVVLMLEKAIRFSTDVRTVLDIFDLVVLCIFFIEFTTKIILDGKNYFFKKYGWINMVATLPILVPVLNFIIIHFYIQFILTKTATSTLSGMRIFRILRIVRVIRIVRVLKLIYHIDKYSGRKPGEEASLTVPALSVLIFVILSYTVIVTQENRMVSEVMKNSRSALSTATASNMNDLFSANPDILILDKDNLVKRRVTDAGLRNGYDNDDYIYLSDRDQNFMVVSVQDQKNLLKFHELFVIIMELLLILSYLIYSRKPLVLSKKGA